MGDLTETSNLLQTTPPSRTVPFREDCWTEEQTVTLVDAWGRRFLELNRGNLRQKDWQQVADAVNAAHGHSKKTRRTDVQCKNRIDTLKKKYKVEKTKILESNHVLSSSWPFFERLEYLIGSNFVKNQNRMNSVSSVSATPNTTHMGGPYGSGSTMLSLPAPPLAVPLGYRRMPYQQQGSAVVTPVVSLPQKRAVPDESYFRRNYSQMAAAAAAEDDDDDEEDEEEEVGGTDGDEVGSEEERGGGGEEDGVRMLAKAIGKFGDIYQRVEGMKQKQMIELEKQRMQFVKELEVQRMQLLMDAQVQMEKMNQMEKMKKPRTRRSAGSSDDVYS